MSRTAKREWSTPDGWHQSKRQERKARPAGRVASIVADELEAEGRLYCDQCGERTLDYLDQVCPRCGGDQMGDGFRPGWNNKEG